MERGCGQRGRVEWVLMFFMVFPWDGVSMPLIFCVCIRHFWRQKYTSEVILPRFHLLDKSVALCSAWKFRMWFLTFCFFDWLDLVNWTILPGSTLTAVRILAGLCEGTYIVEIKRGISQSRVTACDLVTVQCERSQFILLCCAVFLWKSVESRVVSLPKLKYAKTGFCSQSGKRI